VSAERYFFHKQPDYTKGNHAGLYGYGLTSNWLTDLSGEYVRAKDYDQLHTLLDAIHLAVNEAIGGKVAASEIPGVIRERMK
jgi:hypothetical protein